MLLWTCRLLSNQLLLFECIWLPSSPSLGLWFDQLSNSSAWDWLFLPKKNLPFLKFALERQHKFHEWCNSYTFYPPCMHGQYGQMQTAFEGNSLQTWADLPRSELTWRTCRVCLTGPIVFWEGVKKPWKASKQVTVAICLIRSQHTNKPNRQNPTLLPLPDWVCAFRSSILFTWESSMAHVHILKASIQRGLASLHKL